MECISLTEQAQALSIYMSDPRNFYIKILILWKSQPVFGGYLVAVLDSCFSTFYVLIFI